MPKKEVPLTTLADYLPENTTDDVMYYLQQFKVHLTVTRKRESILGDYRNAYQGKAHRISVNGNLNPYSFLITLLHELAHLLTYERYQHKVAPHGKEWKMIFGQLLAGFLQKNIFPSDIKDALRKSVNNPSASSCGDLQLMRVLKKYDQQRPNQYTIESLPLNSEFIINGGRKFIKGEKVRTRYKCIEVSTKKVYLFSAIYDVTICN